MYKICRSANLKMIFLFIAIVDSTKLSAESANSLRKCKSYKLKLSEHPKLVVLSFDGFRYDYIYKTNTPTLNRLIFKGVHSPYMKPQFATKTFPNHQSIATGLHTENHGIMDNRVYDPKYGKFLSGYHKYNEEFWNFSPSVVPVWIYNQWANSTRYSGVFWPGGNHPYGQNRTFPTHYLAYNKSLSFEDRVDYVVKWLTDEDKPSNLVFMYFDEPDGEAHKYGPESPEVVTQIQRMDKITNLLLNRFKTEGIDKYEVNLIILSDHGVQEVSLKNVVNITALIDTSLLISPSVHTPLTQFTPKEGHFEEVYRNLKTGSENMHFSVYKKEELPEEWHYGKNRRVMPIVVLADLGYVFDDFAEKAERINSENDLTASDNRKYGVHGYDNRAASMRAFFLGYGPAFKKGVKIPPFDNTDLFPLFCTLIKIPTPPNNGTLKLKQRALKLG